MAKFVQRTGLAALAACFIAGAAPANAQSEGANAAASKKVAGTTKVRQVHVKPKRTRAPKAVTNPPSSKKTLKAQQREQAKARRQADAAAAQATRDGQAAKP